MINTIVKRDGRCVLFDIDKITDAIFKAAQALGGNDRQTARELAELVAMHVEQAHADGNPPTVEEVQDAVEYQLVRVRPCPHRVRRAGSAPFVCGLAAAAE